MSVDAARMARFTASLERCLSDPAFLDGFYDRFVASSPEVAAKFEGTDFAKQKRALHSSLYLMVMAIEGGKAAATYLQQVARRHGPADLAIRPEMYDIWLDCLVATAQEVDPRFDDALAADWRAVMKVGIGMMLDHA